MDNRLIQSAKQLNKRRHRRRVWTRSLLMLGCAVALGTIYVMSLPAITQEKDTYCGIKAHEHTVECYTKLADDKLYLMHLKLAIITAAELAKRRIVTAYDLRAGCGGNRIIVIDRKANHIYAHIRG